MNLRCFVFALLLSPISLNAFASRCWRIDIPPTQLEISARDIHGNAHSSRYESALSIPDHALNIFNQTYSRELLAEIRSDIVGRTSPAILNASSLVVCPQSQQVAQLPSEAGYWRVSYGTRSLATERVDGSSAIQVPLTLIEDRGNATVLGFLTFSLGADGAPRPEVSFSIGARESASKLKLTPILPPMTTETGPVGLLAEADVVAQVETFESPSVSAITRRSAGSAQWSFESLNSSRSPLAANQLFPWVTPGTEATAVQAVFDLGDVRRSEEVGVIYVDSQSAADSLLLQEGRFAAWSMSKTLMGLLITSGLSQKLKALGIRLADLPVFETLNRSSIYAMNTDHFSSDQREVWRRLKVADLMNSASGLHEQDSSIGGETVHGFNWAENEIVFYPTYYATRARTQLEALYLTPPLRNSDGSLTGPGRSLRYDDLNFHILSLTLDALVRRLHSEGQMEHRDLLAFVQDELFVSMGIPNIEITGVQGPAADGRIVPNFAFGTSLTLQELGSIVRAYSQGGRLGDVQVLDADLINPIFNETGLPFGEIPFVDPEGEMNYQNMAWQFSLNGENLSGSGKRIYPGAAGFKDNRLIIVPCSSGRTVAALRIGSFGFQPVVDGRPRKWSVSETIQNVEQAFCQ